MKPACVALAVLVTLPAVLLGCQGDPSQFWFAPSEPSAVQPIAKTEAPGALSPSPLVTVETAPRRIARMEVPGDTPVKPLSNRDVGLPDPQNKPGTQDTQDPQSPNPEELSTEQGASPETSEADSSEAGTNKQGTTEPGTTEQSKSKAGTDGTKKGERQKDALSLDEVLLSVARTYPLVEVAELERRVAQAKELAALGAFDLSFRGGGSANAQGFYRNETLGLRAEQPLGMLGADVAAGYRLGTGNFDPTFDGKRLTNRGGEFFARARVPLLRNSDSDARRRALRNAEFRRGVADAKAAAQRIKIGREAAFAYWKWVEAGQRLRVVEDLLRLAEVRQVGIATRVQRGALPRIEAVDNERLVVGRRATQIAAARSVERAALALSLFWRNPSDPNPQLPLPDRLPQDLPGAAAPREELLKQDIRRALAQRPELRALDAERMALENDRRFFQSQRLPRADLAIDGSQDLSRRDPTITKGEFELFVGVDVGIQAQNRKATGKLLAVEGELAALSEETRLAGDRVGVQVRDGFSQLRATFLRAQQTIRLAQLAEQVADGERRRFAVGALGVNVLTLNLREEAAAEARLRVIAALVDYQLAAAAYRAAVGEDLLPISR